MGHIFGERSRKQLDTCHPDLVLIMEEALDRSKVDFGISEGHRSIERQKQLFNEGKSKIDGVTKRGKHNELPSMACDIYAYHPDLDTRRKLVYDKSHLAYIAGVVDSEARRLLEEDYTTHMIRWGGNWDGDGVIDFDQSFDDFPHFELYKP